jgi:hypothetical protein
MKTLLVCLTVCLIPLAAHAEPETPDEAGCTLSQELSPTKLLRRTALDLLNRVPTYQEYLDVITSGSITDDILDTYLTSNDYVMAMRRFHEALLWPNPAGAQLHDNQTRLTAKTQKVCDGGPECSVNVYFVNSAVRKATYRKNGNTTCGPWLQDDYDPITGAPIPQEILVDIGNGQTETAFQEGITTVNPYWAPDTEIYVCAFDAQEAETGSSPLVQCDSTRAFKDALCGCGPNLRHCYGPGVQNQLWVDLREQFGRFIDEVTTNARPYSEILTSPVIHQNGRLKFWKKYLAHMVGFNKTYNPQSLGDPELPEAPDYADETWTEESRTDLHSGILTLPAYLLRFQTDRARANRFRIAFTYQYFIPPAQPEESVVTGCNDDTGDLTQLCTCRYCHQVLEPLAAYFHKVADAGSVLLSEELTPYNPKCDITTYATGGMNQGKPMPGGCNRFYIMEADDPNPGWLQVYQFAYVDDPKHDNTGLDDTLHKNIGAHIEEGPAAMAQTVIDSDQLASATVRNLFTYLMDRDMILDPGDKNNEIALLTALARAFAGKPNSGSEYEFPGIEQNDFRSMVRTMVQLPQYRRIR